MKVKAVVSFTGKINMAMDEIKDIEDESIAKDLLNAGYVIEYKADEKPKKKGGKKK